jgi:glycosyltransferase involved in cell wall biosynthesis
MKRLAIVSSYNEGCGNASYTHVLKNAFAEHVEVEVISLDLFLLQKTGSFYERFGDAHIDELAKKIAEFDYVNIQFEAGLYGPTPPIVYRRICKLITAAKRLVFTMHRIDPPEINMAQAVWSVARLRLHPRDALRKVRRNYYAALYKDIIDFCGKAARKKPLSIVVHTPRELRIVRDLYACSHVFQYPITFLREEERAEVLRNTDATVFRQRHHIAEGVKVIGVFGFVSQYKGYETLIQALAKLPAQYHLYIFGAQHPQSIGVNVPLDPYFQRLIDLIYKEDKALKKEKLITLKSLPKKAPLKTEIIDELKEKLVNRVHFVGALSDADFIEALRFSDCTVLPYLEVGQSMSGVISIALEAGANLFCTNNFSFNEARKMYGDVYHTFDIGNYLELAEKIQIASKDFTEAREKAYQKYNIRSNVRKHLEEMGHSVSS